MISATPPGTPLALHEFRDRTPFRSFHRDDLREHPHQPFFSCTPSSMARGDNALLISVILSTLTTSYTSSCISFDKDTDHHSRAQNPTFYSYVPNSRSGRNVIFVAMFFTTFCSIVIKTFGIVLFVLAGQLYFKLYILADLAFFFAYKAIRNDLRYWLNLPNVASLVLSFLIRACTKYLVDFTAVSPTKPRTPHSPFLTTNC